jgi:N6-L-threonylcarbamoyladenine synthase
MNFLVKYNFLSSNTPYLRAVSISPINILAIESSCDDTAAAILQNGKVLCNLVASQKIHKKWGGVVPELASRAHQQNIVPVVDAAIKESGIQKKELSAIAFTSGPGLIGSLLVGASFAKSFALGLNIPIIEVNHMQAHILAHFIDEPFPKFPFLCLTVSGGHTMITKVNNYFDFEVLGKTTDDAAGEAFDKAAKILNLPYPGGPMIDEYAKNGNPKAYQFPTPNIPNLDFSYSGLKTSYLYFIKEKTLENPNFVRDNMQDICASIQFSIINHLIKKLIKASEETGITEIAIAGGVSANTGLRMTIEVEGKKRNWQTYIPKFEYCTDNAAMIAISAYHKFLAGEFALQSLSPNAR